MQNGSVYEMVLQKRGISELGSDYDFLDYWKGYQIRSTDRAGHQNILEFRIFRVEFGSVTAVRWQ
jgi:hypothetical protein